MCRGCGRFFARVRWHFQYKRRTKMPLEHFLTLLPTGEGKDFRSALWRTATHGSATTNTTLMWWTESLSIPTDVSVTSGHCTLHYNYALKNSKWKFSLPWIIPFTWQNISLPLSSQPQISEKARYQKDKKKMTQQTKEDKNNSLGERPETKVTRH